MTTARQFTLFMINGGMIGLLCWALQLAFFTALGKSGAVAYWLSALTASAIGIAVNYRVQRHFIFNRHGNFWAFAVAATVMSIAVSFAAVVGRSLLALYSDAGLANTLGYMAGALAVAPLSFMVKKFLIFRG